MGPGDVLALVGLAGSVVAAGAVATGLPRARAERRARLLWLAAAVIATGAFGVLGAILRVLVHWPTSFVGGFALGCVLVPLGLGLGRAFPTLSLARAVLVQTVVVCGLMELVAVAYLVVVAGMGQVPEGQERTTLALSFLAAGVACVLAFPARRRLEEWANQRVYGERHSPEEALRTFGSRMSRAVPLDELLLQLAETLRKTMECSAVEVWTGSGGNLARVVSVPERGPAGVHLDAATLPVAARAHAQGNAWLQVWIPSLLEGRLDVFVRSVSVSHLGELLGLIVLERAELAFGEEDDRVLVDLARQVGLALHNVRLDSALQASLKELERRNEELVTSRARIVAAADESRRAIERNLHDGAQQHLVALAVKVGLVKALMASDPEAAAAMLDELRNDVQATLTELRELAHGIYPPLLRDRGLGEALLTAANRATLPTVVDAGGIGRYDTDIEAAVYFCCLEALQNAGKYAGRGSEARVTIGNGAGALWFEVHDDGAGFDPALAAAGHGFLNMRDRLGAFGGRLDVVSSPGAGTTVRGTVPVSVAPTPRAAPPG